MDVTRKKMKTTTTRTTMMTIMMMMMYAVVVVAVVVLAHGVQEVNAWWDTGHMLTAAVAVAQQSSEVWQESAENLLDAMKSDYPQRHLLLAARIGRMTSERAGDVCLRIMALY